MRSAARRMEEKFVGGFEEEGRMVLWTDSATGCKVVGVGIAWPRSCRYVFEVPKMWQRGMLCRRQLGTRSSPLLKKREDELVWMQRRKGTEQHTSKRLEKRSKGEESGMAQRGKSAAKRCIVRRTGKRSKRGE